MFAFSAPFNVLNGSLVTTTAYEKIVNDQLIDALTTNQGERVMHPTWGCNIMAMLYNPAGQLERQDAAAYIRDQLIHMVPRAIILGVEVSLTDQQPNVVYIRITYKTSNFSPAVSVSIAADVTAQTGVTA